MTIEEEELKDEGGFCKEEEEGGQEGNIESTMVGSAKRRRDEEEKEDKQEEEEVDLLSNSQSVFSVSIFAHDDNKQDLDKSRVFEEGNINGESHVNGEGIADLVKRRNRSKDFPEQVTVSEKTGSVVSNRRSCRNIKEAYYSEEAEEEQAKNRRKKGKRGRKKNQRGMSLSGDGREELGGANGDLNGKKKEKLEDEIEEGTEQDDEIEADSSEGEKKKKARVSKINNKVVGEGEQVNESKKRGRKRTKEDEEDLEESKHGSSTMSRAQRYRLRRESKVPEKPKTARNKIKDDNVIALFSVSTLLNYFFY